MDLISRLLVLFLLCFCEEFYETKITSILIPLSLASLNSVPRFPVKAKKNPSTALGVFGYPNNVSLEYKKYT